MVGHRLDSIGQTSAPWIVTDERGDDPATIVDRYRSIVGEVCLGDFASFHRNG